MAVMALPYPSVFDVTPNTLLGNNTGSAAAAQALTPLQVRLLCSLYSTSEVDTLLSGKAAAVHVHAASAITSGTIDTARLASGTADATTYLRGDQTWATVTAGVGGSTGARDNAVPRADGTNGDTLQGSNWDIPDIYTASPNATVHHLSMRATGSTTNVSVSIVPKGTGSFSLSVPDGQTAGGNVRGTQALDLQLFRHLKTAVASGTFSVAAGGENTASGYGSMAYGIRNEVVGQYGLGVGLNNSVSGYAAVAIGRALVADRNGVTAFGADAFGLTRLQHIACCMRGTTTDGTTQVELTIPTQGNRLSLVAGTVMTINIKIVGSRDDGSAVAIYERQYAAKRVGNTSSEIQAAVTIGTDVAAGTSVTVDVDDTNDAIRVRVVGVTSQTWEWRAFVLGGEFAY